MPIQPKSSPMSTTTRFLTDRSGQTREDRASSEPGCRQDCPESGSRGRSCGGVRLPVRTATCWRRARTSTAMSVRFRNKRRRQQSWRGQQAAWTAPRPSPQALEFAALVGYGNTQELKLREFDQTRNKTWNTRNEQRSTLLKEIATLPTRRVLTVIRQWRTMVCVEFDTRHPRSRSRSAVCSGMRSMGRSNPALLRTHNSAPLLRAA